MEEDLAIYEKPFYYLGLNTVSKRMLFGVVTVSGVLYALKPESLFYEDGSPRPCSLFSDSEGSVLLPFWAYGLGAGFVISTFI